VDEDIPAAAGKTLFVADERLEEPRAYEITKAILEHTPELTAALTAAKEFTPTNAVLGSSIPFHPGALRYYTGKGHSGATNLVASRPDSAAGRSAQGQTRKSGGATGRSALPA
jgi:NMT1-like family